MNITIKIRSAYGNTLFDPVDDNAKIFASLTEKKTLTESALRNIKKLGVSINVQGGDIPAWLASND